MKNPISRMSMQKNKVSGVPAQIGIGAGIENSRYQNKAKLKNQSDVNAELFSKMADKFKSRDGGRPRGAWANFGAGVMEGMEYAEKSRSVKQREEDYDKYDRVMEYFQAVNNDAMEKAAWYEQRESAKRELMPQVLAYMDNIDKLDPQSQRIMAQDMLAQYGEAIGEDFKLSSIDGSNPFLMTIQSEKGQQLFDLRSMFAGDEAIQQAVAMKMPEYQMRLQEQRDKQEEKFELEKFKAGAPSKYGTQNDNDSQTFEYDGQQYETVSLNGLQKSEAVDYGKMVNKAVSQIPVNENAIKSVNAMREVFERNPDIGSSFIHMLDSGDENSWGTWLRKKFVSEQERADMEILKKASSDLNLSTVLSVPGKSATDLLKQTIKSASPTGTLTKQAFDKIANEWEQRALENIGMAKAQAIARAKKQMIVSKVSSAQMGDGGSEQDEGNPFGTLWKERQ
jgi:hypothetical protein